VFKYLLFFILLFSCFGNGYANQDLFQTKTNLNSENIKQAEANKINKKPKKYLKQKNSIKPILFSAMAVSLVFFIIRYRNYIFDYIRFHLKILLSEDQKNLLQQMEVEFEKKRLLQVDKEKAIEAMLNEQIKSINEIHKHERDLLKKEIEDIKKERNEFQNEQNVTHNRLDRVEAGMVNINPSFVKYQKSYWKKSFSKITRQLQAVLGISGHALYFAISTGPSLILILIIYRYWTAFKGWAAWGKDKVFSSYKHFFDTPSRTEVGAILNQKYADFIVEMRKLKTELDEPNQKIISFVENKVNEMTLLIENWNSKLGKLETKMDTINISLGEFEQLKSQVNNFLENVRLIKENFNPEEKKLDDIKEKLARISSIYETFKEQVGHKDDIVSGLLATFEGFTNDFNSLKRDFDIFKTEVKSYTESTKDDFKKQIPQSSTQNGFQGDNPTHSNSNIYITNSPRNSESNQPEDQISGTNTHSNRALPENWKKNLKSANKKKTKSTKASKFFR